MRRIPSVPLAAIAAAVLGWAAVPSTAPAQGLMPTTSAYGPTVPVSSFARPASWLDPSRFKIATSISVGTGFGGQSQALGVTSFMYQFRAPVTMRVNVGTTFGTGGFSTGGNTFFLEGLDVTWQPSANSMVRVSYHDFRSPLQYSPYGYGGYNGYAPWGW